MAQLVFADSFIEDMVQVALESKRSEITRTVALLTDVPEIGSGLLPQSIRKQYGDTVRKLVVSPFDVVYEYFPDVDEVHVLALIHQRMAQ